MEPEVQEKRVDSLWMAGVRMQGAYDEIGKGFGLLWKKVGRHVRGKPFCLHYSKGYVDGTADFEACVPLCAPVEAEGLSVRELPGGRCVSLLHEGPYDTISHSYEKIGKYLEEKGLQVAMPSREIYLKGPGMLFRGNPKKYVTEIQMMIQE